MIQYIATATTLICLALVLSACGARNAPSYDYAANGQTPYRYAPLYD